MSPHDQCMEHGPLMSRVGEMVTRVGDLVVKVDRLVEKLDPLALALERLGVAIEAMKEDLAEHKASNRAKFASLEAADEKQWTAIGGLQRLVYIGVGLAMASNVGIAIWIGFMQAGGGTK